MSATSQLHTKMHISLPGVEAISALLRSAFVGRGARKRVAAAADADPRTASAWLYGQAAPRAPELIALMAENDELERQIVTLVHELREQRHCPTPTS